MCGIFAAFPGTGARVAPELVQKAAFVAGRRGPHGHGWVNADGITRDLGYLDVEDVPAHGWIIGHARLATDGMPRDESGLQPVTVDGHVIVHNGVIVNWRELDARAPTDSWAFGSFYAHLRRSGRDHVSAFKEALRVAEIRTGALLVLDSSGHLMAWRAHLPLWAFKRDGVLYLGSAMFDVACISLTENGISRLGRVLDHAPVDHAGAWRIDA